jgi:hypothetical protein
MHMFAGRVAAATYPAMVTFCRCGLGFFGKDASESDQRFNDHLAEARKGS